MFTKHYRKNFVLLISFLSSFCLPSSFSFLF